MSGWGGRLYFVYLPWQARYRSESIRRGLDEVRGNVLSEVADLKIPLIDLQPVLLERGAASLYVPRPGSHFTVEGYRVVAETILGVLSREDKKAGGATSGPESAK